MASLNSRGFSLTEALTAIALLTTAAVAILPAFLTHMDTNGRNEERNGAVAVSEQVMEALRLQDPISMPTSGSSAAQLITVDDREYSITTHFCERSEFCASTGVSRHIRVEVQHDGDTIYEIETVYTQLL